MSNKKECPLITIGITCFNAERSIENVIKNALQQCWPNIEIIIVDDASKDDSVQIIKDLQKKNTSIQLYCHAENLGYPSALNTIIHNATGQYIAFFDDDDEHVLDRLIKQYERLSTFESIHPDKPILCYSHRRVLVEGIENKSIRKAIGYKPPEPHGTMVADFILWSGAVRGYTWGSFGSGTLMASRKTLSDFGFDPNFKRSAEWDLAVRAALKGGYFIAVDEPLVLQHKTLTSDKAGKIPLKYALMLRRKHKAYLRKNHVYWGSILETHARFNIFRSKPWKGRIFLVLACVFSPCKFLIHKLHKRIR